MIICRSLVEKSGLRQGFRMIARQFELGTAPTVVHPLPLTFTSLHLTPPPAPIHHHILAA